MLLAGSARMRENTFLSHRHGDESTASGAKGKQEGLSAATGGGGGGGAADGGGPQGDPL